jgi:hypothetical protein
MKTNKLKPKKRPSEKLVEDARDCVLDAYNEAADLLTEKERLDLIVTLREDLSVRQREIEYAAEARAFAAYHAELESQRSLMPSGPLLVSSSAFRRISESRRAEKKKRPRRAA